MHRVCVYDCIRYTVYTHIEIAHTKQHVYYTIKKKPCRKFLDRNISIVARALHFINVTFNCKFSDFDSHTVTIFRLCIDTLSASIVIPQSSFCWMQYFIILHSLGFHHNLIQSTQIATHMYVCVCRSVEILY